MGKSVRLPISVLADWPVHLVQSKIAKRFTVNIHDPQKINPCAFV